MFTQVIDETAKNLFRWLDVVVFGAFITFYGLVVMAVFEPFWQDGFGALADQDMAGSTVTTVIVLSFHMLVFNSGFAFLTTVLTTMILDRLRGGDITVGEAIGSVREIIGAVLRYAVVYTAFTVFVGCLFFYLIYGFLGLEFAARFAFSPLMTMVDMVNARTDTSQSFLVLILIVLMIVWSSANALVYPVMVSSRIGGLAAIRRSATLVIRRWGILVSMPLIAFFFAFLIDMVFFPEYYVALMTQGLTSAWMPGLIMVLAFGFSTLSMLITAFFNSAWYRAVYDFRVLPKMRHPLDRF